MYDQFQFENFVPAPELESFANIALYSALDSAPQDSTATAIVERVGEYYSCRIEIMSVSGPFAVSVSAYDPKLAVERGIQKLKDKIAVWQKLRLGFKNFLPIKGAPEAVGPCTKRLGTYVTLDL
jgi:hypothetical protein